MRNDVYAKSMLAVCAVAGCLAGFGIDALLHSGQQQNNNAKDNTLLREENDGVFFDEENREEDGTETSETMTGVQVPITKGAPVPTVTPMPTVTPGSMEHPKESPVPTKAFGLPEHVSPGAEKSTPGMTSEVVPTVLPTQTPTPALANVTPTISMAAGASITPAITPAITPEITPVITPETGVAFTPTVTPAMTASEQDSQVITYPAEIFGQTPRVNRTDGQVTYFEFALDLIELLEGEIQQKKLSETALFSKFVLKALFCGIEITNLNINAPIPRDQAALAIHLAAEVMDKRGTGTSAKSAIKYVTDIGGCSSAEKRAIAYLYEQGIVSGYSVQGQRFLPDATLTETDGSAWRKRLKECWK